MKSGDKFVLAMLIAAGKPVRRERLRLGVKHGVNGALRRLIAAGLVEHVPDEKLKNLYRATAKAAESTLERFNAKKDDGDE